MGDQQGTGAFINTGPMKGGDKGGGKGGPMDSGKGGMKGGPGPMGPGPGEPSNQPNSGTGGEAGPSNGPPLTAWNPDAHEWRPSQALRKNKSRNIFKFKSFKAMSY